MEIKFACWTTVGSVNRRSGRGTAAADPPRVLPVVRGAEVHADPDLAAQRPGRRDTLPAAQLGPSDGVGLIVRHGRKGELQEPHFLPNTLC